MLFKFLNWLGMMQPEQRARREVADIDRQIFDAEKVLHSARATLAYLSQRRDFLIDHYGFQDPPSSFSNLAALAPPVRKVARRPKKPQPAQVVQTMPLALPTDKELQAAYDDMVRARTKKQH